MALGACLVCATSGSLPAVAHGNPRPHIGAQPTTVPEGETTTLKGRGFPANVKIKLVECSLKFWILPAEPCDRGSFAVQTDASGAFITTYRVNGCPREIEESRPVLKSAQREKCFVGELEFGEDFAFLLGPVKIVVTT
jgi:hypothetical protein